MSHRALSLGPMLFLVYINDLLDSNLGSLDSKIQVYADDVLLYKTITSPSDFIDLQSIDCVSTWSQDNFLSLNHNECKYVDHSESMPDPMHKSSAFGWDCAGQGHVL